MQKAPGSVQSFGTGFCRWLALKLWETEEDCKWSVNTHEWPRMKSKTFAFFRVDSWLKSFFECRKPPEVFNRLVLDFVDGWR